VRRRVRLSVRLRVLTETCLSIWSEFLSRSNRMETTRAEHAHGLRSLCVQSTTAAFRVLLRTAAVCSHCGGCTVGRSTTLAGLRQGGGTRGDGLAQHDRLDSVPREQKDVD
jgi:hypothetical protein